MSNDEHSQHPAGAGTSTRDGTRALRHDDLWSIPVPSDPQVSPDGTQVAFVVTTPDRGSDDYRSTIWLVASAGGAPRALTDGLRDRAPRWSPGGRRLAFLSTREDDEEAQIHVLSLDSGERCALTGLSHGADAPVWSPDGRWIAFTAPVGDDDDGGDRGPVVISRLDYKADGTGLLREVRQQLFVIDTESAVAEPLQLTAGEFSASSPVWSPDATRLAFSRGHGADSDLERNAVVHVVPVAGGASIPLSPERGVYTVADWSPDGDTLLVVGKPRASAGDDHLCVLPAKGGAPRRLTPDHDRGVDTGSVGYPGALPRYAPDGRVLFCARDHGAVHIFEVDAAGGDPAVRVGGDRVVSGMSAAAGALAFVAASPTSPGEVWIGGTEERALTQLFARALPEVRLVGPQAVSFRTGDDIALDGWIVRDETLTGSGPLLLDIHGGPHNAWGPAFDGAHLYHQTLAAAGWTVLMLNPRGSAGYGEAFRTASVGAWGTGDEADFLGAVDDLVARGIADPERVCVSGYSYGGYMTCWLTARSDRFAAAAAGGCISDLVSMVGTSDIGHFLASAELDTSVGDRRELLARCSPLGHADEAATPTLLLHGERDDRCPVGQAEQWFAALRERGVPVEFVRYPDQSHLFILNGRPSHRVDYAGRVHAWMTRWTAPRG